MSKKINHKLFWEIGIVLCLVAAIISIAAYNISNKKEEEKSRLSNVLSTILKIENQAITNWFEGRKLHIEDVVKDPTVVDFAEHLLEMKALDKDTLITQPIQKEIRAFFEPILQKYGYLGIFIISPQYISLSSMRDENIGTLNIIAKNEQWRLDKAFGGETMLITPFLSEVALTADNQTAATMFIATPIRNKNDEVIAVFTFRLDPKASLSSFTEMSWFGKTSNTYAFNSDGRLITQSRHELKGENEKTNKNIENLGIKLIDPETDDYIFSVQKALNAEVMGASEESYNNYKGISVFGAWVWNESLGIGLTSEISEEEGLFYYFSYKRSITVTTSIIILLLISITSVLIINRRKTQFLYQKIQEKMGVLENSLSLFVANAPVGIARSSMDGKFLEINQEFCQFTGYNQDELKALSYWDLTPIAYKDQEEQQLKSLAEKGRYGPYEKEYYHKDGHLINVLLSGIIVKAQDEEDTIWSVVQDITENKKNEKALVKSKELAERANLTKSTFLANMSHEIRTPLNSILGHAQILQHSGDLSEQEYKSSQSIMKSGEHLLTLINDILDLSKIEAGKIIIHKTSFDLKLLLSDLFVLFDPTAEKKGISLTFELAPDLPKIIFGDEQRIRQVIINLLSNAIKFTETGGVTLSVLLKDGNLLIEVKDTGAGIPEDNLETIFDTFEQTETGLKTKGGVGLGLSISRDLARVMGGDVTVSSKLGRGSVFTFTIVYTAGDLNEVASSKKVAKRVLKLKEAHLGLRVLIVDDVVQNLEVAEALLKPIGFHVETTEQGRQIEQKVRQFLPDVVLLDLKISDVDTIEVIKKFRAMEDLKQIPIIAVSASILEEDRSKYLAAGLDAIVLKPYRIEEVLEKIKTFTRVAYYYDETNNEQQKTGTEATFHLISELPGNLVESVLQATIIGDIEELENLNRQISEIDPALGVAIQKLIDEFEFERLKKIFSGNQEI